MFIDTYISEEKIKKKVLEISENINRDFAGKELVIIGVLNGAFIFVSDLIRLINIPISLDFVAISSYVGNKSSGEINFLKDIKIDIENKNILIVEDIVDTGLTMFKLKEHFEKKNPAEIKIASFLYKPLKVKKNITVDYFGFEVNDHFLVGYGLDFNEKYRNLPYLGIYHEN